MKTTKLTHRDIDALERVISILDRFVARHADWDDYEYDELASARSAISQWLWERTEGRS